jgi:YegS/Rv2252/BmrU family lipid kinase
MRKATLLYNPNSGRRRREAELEKALQVLRSAGVGAEIVVCRSSETATEQARRAVAEGSDTVFACGGDGTISDVLQAVAGTEVALAVLPMGTANALAHDLALPFRLVDAAHAALHGKHRRISLGRIEYLDFSGETAARYFTVAAGIGVDAHLFYKLTSALKQRTGMATYYLKAWQLWATHHMRRFDVEYSTNGDRAKHRASLTELLAVRIRFFGGVLRELVPGASLESRELRAVMCRTSSRNAYLQYVAGGLLGRRWNIAGIDLVSCSEIVCQLPENGERVFVEADGELLGRLPARMTMVPDALSLVTPA